MSTNYHSSQVQAPNCGELHPVQSLHSLVPISGYQILCWLNVCIEHFQFLQKKKKDLDYSRLLFLLWNKIEYSGFATLFDKMKIWNTPDDFIKESPKKDIKEFWKIPKMGRDVE